MNGGQLENPHFTVFMVFGLVLQNFTHLESEDFTPLHSESIQMQANKYAHRLICSWDI